MHARRVAEGSSPSRYVTGNHAARTDQRIITYTERKDDRATADPDIPADTDGAAEFKTDGSYRRVARMIGREDLHRGANLCAVADADCDDISQR